MSLLIRTGRPAAATALVLALAACGGDEADSPAVDPSSEPSMDPSMPGMDMGS